MSLSSVIRYVRALDSTATDGAGKAGLAFGDVTAKYLTQGGTLTSLTTETITTLGTYQAPTSAAHIRIKELSSSDPCKGVYEVHFHNTQVAASGVKLWLFLSASGAAFQPLELDLVPYQADVTAINGTSIAGTGTRVADRFLAFFNVASGGFDASTAVSTLTAGAAMTLTSGERTAVANEVEAQIIDETDSEKVLTAITDKIASVNPSLAGLTLAAIAAAVRDVANTAPAANSLGAGVKACSDRMPGSGTLSTLTAAEVNAEADTALADYDGPTKAELDSAVAPLATASALASVAANVSTLLARVTSTLFSGITSLAAWLGALAGKTADASTQTEIRATTAGASYTITTDSLEAQRDNVGTAGANLSVTVDVDEQAIADAVVAALGEVADPLLNEVPGDYPTGTAGFNIGLLAAGTITVSSLVIDADGNVRIVRGMSYFAADGRAIDWTISAGVMPDLTGATVTWWLGSFSKAMTVVTSGAGAQKVRLELTSAQSATFADPGGHFWIVAALATSGHLVEVPGLTEARVAVVDP